MKKLNKIALSGAYHNGKTLVSLALSDILNIPRAHVEDMDTLYENVFHQWKNPKYFSVVELITMGLARFHSRIRQESGESFVSDGSVLNELAYGKARLEMANKSNVSVDNILYGGVHRRFSERLERTIIDYAKSNYDMVFLLQIAPKDELLNDNALKFQELFEKYFVTILAENEIPFKILTGNPVSFIQTILYEMNRTALDEDIVNLALINALHIKSTQPQEFQYAL